MKVIDARSGREMRIGDTVEYGDGERLRLIDVDSGLFSASAVIETTYRDHGTRVEVGRPPLITRRAQVPMPVHWLHPRFLFQHVAFIPS